MQPLFPNKAPIVKPEKIKFSELRNFALTDGRKDFQWPDQHVGHCTLQFPQLLTARRHVRIFGKPIIISK